MSSEAWDDYGVPVSPYFVLVDGPRARSSAKGRARRGTRSSTCSAGPPADRDTAPGAAGARQPRMGGQDRADRVDAELRAAGIEPGDPSLYPAAHPSHARGDDR